MDEYTKNLTTLLGYEELTLIRPVKERKTVKVKCLPIRKLPEYAALFNIEVELIALCTELTPEEVDMLHPDDSGKIFNKIHDLNYGPFSAWLKRKADAAKLEAQIYGLDLPKSKSQNNGEDYA